MDVSIPRDRKGEFEPQLLKKNQSSISQEIEEKILSMYAKGMTTGDIETHIRDIYGLEVSDTTVSRITDKILLMAKEWQQRPLEEVRRLIYTTNTIEGFNRQLRKVTKAKSVFPTDDSLLKMLYLAMMNITPQ